MDSQELGGGCQCGAVRYAVREAALDSYHCHCSVCRKIQGALFGTYSIFPDERFTLLSGSDFLDAYDTSPGTHRLFCRRCGCNILARLDGEPGKTWIATATLDGGAAPEGLMTTLRHIFVGSKVPWYTIADSLPQKDEG